MQLVASVPIRLITSDPIRPKLTTFQILFYVIDDLKSINLLKIQMNYIQFIYLTVDILIKALRSKKNLQYVKKWSYVDKWLHKN